MRRLSGMTSAKLADAWYPALQIALRVCFGMSLGIETIQAPATLTLTLRGPGVWIDVLRKISSVTQLKFLVWMNVYQVYIAYLDLAYYTLCIFSKLSAPLSL